MLRLTNKIAFMLLTGSLLWACELPSDSDTTTSSSTAVVSLSATPDPAQSAATNGKTYVIQRTDKADEVLEYDRLVSFTVIMAETAGLRVYITGVTIQVQQAFGGIVAPATNGETEHFEFVSRPSNNVIQGKGSESMQFNVWYHLPNKGSEALVTVTLAFQDKNEAKDALLASTVDPTSNDVNFSKTITVRVQ